MNLPTIEETRAAYKRNGFVPAYGHVSVINRECCAIGALLDGKAINTNDGYAVMDFPYNFAQGFDYGIRGVPMRAGMSYSSPGLSAYTRGWEIGKDLKENPL